MYSPDPLPEESVRMMALREASRVMAGYAADRDDTSPLGLSQETVEMAKDFVVYIRGEA
jgi:hypothetical protein